MASYAGAAAFFALEAVARQPGEASDLAATDSDQGTTRQIVAAYALAAGLSPLLGRLRAGRLPPVSGPAGVAMMAAGLALIFIPNNPPRSPPVGMPIADNQRHLGLHNQHRPHF